MKFVTITSKHIYVVLLVFICVAAGAFYYFHRGNTQQVFTVQGATGPEQTAPDTPPGAPGASPASETAAPYSPAPIQPATRPSQPETAPAPPKILTVYITGAVNSAGMYQIQKGKRVDDLIKMAGGAADDADLTRVNLAAYVEDAQHIVVPKKDDVIKPDTNAGSSGGSSRGSSGGSSKSSSGGGKKSASKGEPASPVNINTAGSEELQTLPGIGPVTADAIILFRTRYGPFKTPAAIQAVHGVGLSEYLKIEQYITVD